MVNKFKNAKAYINGHFYTSFIGSAPAAAVLVKDGIISEIGDNNDVLAATGDNVEVVDLGGRWVLPGFIDAHRNFILEIMAETYLKIEPVWDMDSVLDELEFYISECFTDTIFGWGFDQNIFELYPGADEQTLRLDEIERNMPVLLLSKDGKTVWMNTAAQKICFEKNIIGEAEYRNSDYTEDQIFNLVVEIYDFRNDEITDKFSEMRRAASESGFTSIVDFGSPSVFKKIVTDAINNKALSLEDVALRFPGTAINSFVPSSGIPCEYIQLDLVDGGDVSSLTESEVTKIVKDNISSGRPVHIEAAGNTALETAIKAADLAMTDLDNNLISIASDNELKSYEGIKNLNNITFTWLSSEVSSRIFEHSDLPEEAATELTEKAAKIAATSSIGKIEKGRFADFTIFETDPFNTCLRAFRSNMAYETIIAGETAWNRDYDLLNREFSIMNGELF